MVLYELCSKLEWVIEFVLHIFSIEGLSASNQDRTAGNTLQGLECLLFQYLQMEKGALSEDF